MILSIISPCFNEEKYIAQTIESFLQQQCHSFGLEILIVDGRSTDNTRNIINEYALKNPQVKLVDNPKRKTPFAFNEGLKAAQGEYIAILGAHSVYEPGYLQTCYDELIKTGSVGCSGRVITQSAYNNIQAMLCEWVMCSVFGVSSLSFRIVKEGYVHSVNFPVFKKQVVLDIGGYNTLMERNQDNDLNQRILDAGHKLYCTWKTSCFYRPPADLNKLFFYGYRNGFWNARSFKLFPRSMRFHHLVPFLFTTCIIFLLFVGMIEKLLFHSLYGLDLLLLSCGFYFFIACLATIVSIRQKFDMRKLLMPFIFFAFHFSYGWGTLKGFLRKEN